MPCVKEEMVYVCMPTMIPARHHSISALFMAQTHPSLLPTGTIHHSTQYNRGFNVLQNSIASQIDASYQPTMQSWVRSPHDTLRPNGTLHRETCFMRNHLDASRRLLRKNGIIVDETYPGMEARPTMKRPVGTR